MHCGAGVSRVLLPLKQSAAFVIAYLIKFHRMSFLSALKFVRKRRKEICPNLNFEYQLKKYDLKIHSRTKDLN